MTEVKIKITPPNRAIKEGTYLLINDVLMQVIHTAQSEYLLLNVLAGNRELDDIVPVPCSFDDFFTWYQECAGENGTTISIVEEVKIEAIL